MTRVTCTIAIVVLLLAMMPQATAVVPGGLCMVRDISEQTVEPGSMFTVTVTLTANGDVNVSAPALNEDLPDGWTVAENNFGGAYYKASTNEWIWLTAMTAGDSKTVVYNVTVPGDAEPQEYEIAGTVSSHLVEPINVSGENTVTVVALPAMSATRDISEETVVPGSTFTVTVTLTANEDVVAPALNEDLPDGWTVAENNFGGAYYKESTSEWIWLAAMATGDSKTVVYDVTVPVDAEPQEYEIAGTVSAYLVDPIDVDGESTVTVVVAIDDGDETTDHVVINEFVANPCPSDDEWVELYNPTASDVPLDGWTLKDGGKAPKDLSGMSIPAGGYAVFSCGSRWLNNGGDIIHLNNTTANVDSVTYGNWDDGDTTDNALKPGTGESTGRDPNGVDTDNDVADFRIFDTPTEGLVNTCDAPLGGYGNDGGSGDGGSGDAGADAGSVPPGSEMSVTRDISSQLVEPGSTFTVTLTILANKAVDVVAPTLVENVSIGTIVVDLDSTLDLADVLDPNNSTQNVSDTWYNDSAAMWILPERIPSGESLTVAYSVTVPDNALPQEYSITGSASAYDVTSVAIGGEGEVNVVQFNMQLTAGWNLVSIPVVLADPHVDSVFPTKLGSVWSWNATIQGYEAVTTLEPNEGYWVLVTSPTTMPPLIGNTPSSTLLLEAGWNMVGMPVSHEVPESDITGHIGSIWGWNAATQGYESTTALEPTKGYSVLVTEPTWITIR